MNDHLREWLARTPGIERERVARDACTTVGHLRQLAGGHRKASPDLAERLQDASSGGLTIAGLRPDLAVLAEKILNVTMPVAEVVAPPTLSQTIRKIAQSRQPSDGAGVLSSAQRISKLAPPEALA